MTSRLAASVFSMACSRSRVSRRWTRISPASRSTSAPDEAEAFADPQAGVGKKLEQRPVLASVVE
jgi:hypothetical protein